jgi:hypothetical protein
MKIKTLLFLAVTFAASMLKAQEYEIVSVEPDTLFPGENMLTITLIQEIVDYDSIIVHINGTS